MKTIELTTKELLFNYFNSLANRTWYHRLYDDLQPNWHRRQTIIDTILKEDEDGIRFLFSTGYTTFLLSDDELEDFEDTPKAEEVELHIMKSNGETICYIHESDCNFKFDEYWDLKADEVTA